MAKQPPLTDPRFESAPLDTSRPQLRRQYPYEHYILNEFGSLNLDANDSTLQKGELTDALNLRMTKPGEYEVRTGTHDYANGGITGTLLCKSEFRYKNFILDISVIWTSLQTVRVIGVNNMPIGAGLWTSLHTVDLGVIVASGLVTAPIAAATQYQNYIVITIYDVGTFAIYPTGTVDDPAQFDTWTVIPLGKSLCPTPAQVRYVDERTDDLINFHYTDRSDGIFEPIPNPLANNSPSPTPPFLYDRIKIKTPYIRAAETGQPFNLLNVKLWQWNQNDPTANTGPSSRGHLQTRAWGYRFVFIRSVPDGRGGKIVFRSQGSTDMWVPNNIYCPPQLYITRGGKTYRATELDSSTQIATTGGGYRYVILNDSTDAIVGHKKWPDTNLSGDTIDVLPTEKTMVSFANAILSYANRSVVDGLVYEDVGPLDVEIPFIYYTLWYAGWRENRKNNVQVQFNGTNQSVINVPYWCDVPASFLANAPLAIFKWTDFSLLADGLTPNPAFPSDVTEIEVYRTAFSDGDAKSTDGDPLFQPDLYGYVGSIKVNKDFTDDIKDNAVDFAKAPDRYDGFLGSQFSGQAIRHYNRKLVIGNTSTSYWVDAPAPFVMQAYAFTDANGNYTDDHDATKDVVHTAADTDPTDNGINKLVQFYYSYVDAEGNESDLAKVYVENPTPFLTIKGRVAFLVGQGYSPYITSVRLYKSYFVAGTRNYFFIKEIDVNTGYYISDGNETAIATTNYKPGKHTVDGTSGGKITRTPGGVIWSGVYAPFDWDPLHNEVISTEAPIMYLDSLIGELWIFTDRGVHLSNIDNQNPKGEEESEEIGVIGRFAAVKVDKVIFFLSSGGLYFAESSGVHPFPGMIQTEVLKYTNETISGQPDLANIRRASMGYSKKRQELWLYLPCSTDLGGVLPEKLFIFKFFSHDIDAASIRRHVNYQFEFTDILNSPPDTPVPPGDQVIFQGHSDGRLFASYGITGVIHTLDNDLGKWHGKTCLEFVMGLIDLTTIKMLRKLEVTGDFDCDLRTYTGIINPSHVSDESGSFPRGLANAFATQYTFDEAKMGTNVKLPHVIAESLWNTTANAPVVRLVSNADSGGDNIVRYKAIDVWYQFIHDHP